MRYRLGVHIDTVDFEHTKVIFWSFDSVHFSLKFALTRNWLILERSECNFNLEGVVCIWVFLTLNMSFWGHSVHFS